MHILVFILIIALCILKAFSASVSLDAFIGLFENCTVKLYNYQNKDVPISATPVSIITNTTFRLEKNHPGRTRIPFHCLALFYVQPRRGLSIRDYIKEQSGDRDSWIAKYRPTDTKTRYDILVTSKKVAIKIWRDAYTRLMSEKVSSYGLDVYTETSQMFGNVYIRDNIYVTNRLQLTNSKFILVSRNIYQVIKIQRRSALDQMVEDVNDLRNNWDVSWRLESVNYPIGLSIGLYQQHGSTNSEASDNYYLAKIALGSNVTIKNDVNFLSKFPAILFDVPGGTMMRNSEQRRFSFITCANVGRQRFVLGFADVFHILVGQFEWRVYIGMAVFYLLPAILLGLLYHGLIKTQMLKTYWLKWDPFTWGIRALIWQAGDRCWNSKRFGWMVYLDTAWLLGAVVISHAFLGANIYGLNMPSYRIYQNSWTSFQSLKVANVTIVTDIWQFGLMWPMIGFESDSYWSTSDLVKMNTTIAYVTHETRANEVMNEMGWSRWDKGRCSDGMKVRKGYVRAWDVDGLDWQQRRQLFSNEPTGWKILNCNDIRLFRRLRRLEGESGIVGNVRRLANERNNGRSEDANGLLYISTSMQGNIKWVFAAAGCGFGVALVMWFLEWVLWKLYTQPKRNKQARLKKKEAARLEMVKMEVVAADREDGVLDASRTGSEDIGDDLLVAAVPLVEDQHKRKDSTESAGPKKDLSGTTANDEPILAAPPVDADAGVKHDEECNSNNAVVENDIGDSHQWMDFDKAFTTRQLNRGNNDKSPLGTELDKVELDSKSVGSSVYELEAADEFKGNDAALAPVDVLVDDVDLSNADADHFTVGDVSEEHDVSGTLKKE